MSLFKFNDDKSRKQIDKAKCRGLWNDTGQQNADNLVAYQRKVARLVDSRNEWELVSQ